MRVKELRKKTGLSQSKFAKLFNIPTYQIQNWEQGYRNPKPYIVEMMEKILRYEGWINKEDTKNEESSK